jgi:hypothetical protein
MTAAKSSKQSGEGERQDEAFGSRIGRRVMDALGTPGALLTVQVRALWKDRYRVNVLVGTGGPSPKVAHSFFLVVDEEGVILDSTPAITRLY